MNKTFWVLGCVLGFAGVAAGAFGAHALRGKLSQELLAVWETAVRFQMYHSLALLAAAWATSQWANRAAEAAGWLFAAGTVIFCGSLYLLALSGTRWLGAITPLGGLMMLAGWGALGWSGWQR
jgi:uncharacterized membrane protein YgdD (TMEM256/DUF423 family)